MDSSQSDAERQIGELLAQMARQQKLAADLTRHGFKGAAAEALRLLAILQARLARSMAGKLETPIV
jgi:hypothetical protein